MLSVDVLIIGSGVVVFCVVKEICYEKNVIIIIKEMKCNNNIYLV